MPEFTFLMNPIFFLRFFTITNLSQMILIKSAYSKLYKKLSDFY
ncbi:hypothetical protein GW12_11940 [Acinetobacter sp. HR7]|nr:hypothetical protein GW12_11940 [Acinetobacter sp. HR7]